MALRILGWIRNVLTAALLRFQGPHNLFHRPNVVPTPAVMAGV